jgi:hypothetical protein
MDLHSIASQAIAAVNPMTWVTFRQSSGYSTDAAGKRTPTYLADQRILVQLQGLADKELRQMNALNIGGILSKVYAEGAIANVIRRNQTGGDLLIIGGVTWLTVHVLEQWPDWCSVAIQQQVDA